MARSSSLQPLQGFLLCLAGVLSLLLPTNASDSIHDLLLDHGLPPGLLPKAVKSFSLDRDTGLLEVRLDQPCYAKYDNMVFFDQVVSGNLSYGQLKGVEGFSQEELFLWLPVKGILVSDLASGVIFFDIGVAHKQLSLSLFEDPPDCKPEEEGDLGIGDGNGLLDRKVKGFLEER